MLQSQRIDENSAILHITLGTWRIRLRNSLLIFRLIPIKVSLAIFGWFLLWAAMGLQWGRFPEAMKYAAVLLIFLFAVFFSVNTLGIDPGQRIVLGKITMTPTTVYQENRRGKIRERGWKWIVRAKEGAGGIRIVLSWARSSILLPYRPENELVCQRIRKMLVDQNKLSS